MSQRDVIYKKLQVPYVIVAQVLPLWRHLSFELMTSAVRNGVMYSNLSQGQKVLNTQYLYKIRNYNKT